MILEKIFSNFCFPSFHGVTSLAKINVKNVLINVFELSWSHEAKCQGHFVDYELSKNIEIFP